MNPVVIIPARMSSSRLPGKPLANISGETMIVHVMKRALEADIGPVYVACCEKEVADAVFNAGGKAVMTKPEHPSGTDRIYEAYLNIENSEDYNVIINVQGDLPTVSPQVICDILKPLEDEAVDISTLAAEIIDERERTDPNVVKVIADFSAGDVVVVDDFTRSTPDANTLYHHIGMYGYRKDALKKFTALPPSAREQAHRLEQLRAIDNGMIIGASLVGSVPLGVDTEEDLERARNIINEEN